MAETQLAQEAIEKANSYFSYKPEVEVENYPKGGKYEKFKYFLNMIASYSPNTFKLLKTYFMLNAVAIIGLIGTIAYNPKITDIIKPGIKHKNSIFLAYKELNNS